MIVLKNDALDLRHVIQLLFVTLLLPSFVKLLLPRLVVLLLVNAVGAVMVLKLLVWVIRQLARWMTKGHCGLMLVSRLCCLKSLLMLVGDLENRTLMM